MRWLVAVVVVRHLAVGCDLGSSTQEPLVVDGGFDDAGVGGDAGVGAGNGTAGGSAGVGGGTGTGTAGGNGVGGGSGAAGGTAGGSTVDAGPRLDAGTLDVTFGDGGLITCQLTAIDALLGMAVQPDGKVVAFGSSYNFTQMSALRLNGDGSRDPGFGDLSGSITFSLGTSPADIGVGLRLLPDGRMVGVGTTTIGSAVTRMAAIRLLADGTLDPSFGATGPGFTALPPGTYDTSAASIEVQPDGKLVLGGCRSPGSGDYLVARLLPDGQLDTTFNLTGSATFASPSGDLQNGMALQTNGAIILAGMSDTHASMVRFTSMGAIDQGFGDGGVVFDDFTAGYTSLHQAVLLQPDGKIVGIGYQTNGTLTTMAVVRYQPSGARDPTFGTNGIVSPASGQGYAGFLDAAGRIVFAGNAGGKFLVGRLLPSGAPDTSFGTGGLGRVWIDFGGTNQYPSAVLPAPNGQLVVGGISSNRYALARLWQ